jgi:hypothetical protein
VFPLAYFEYSRPATGGANYFGQLVEFRVCASP